jgi:hypothetical protein
VTLTGNPEAGGGLGTGRPKATSEKETTDNTVNTTSTTARGAQLFRIANDGILKRSRNGEENGILRGQQSDAWSKRMNYER